MRLESVWNLSMGFGIEPPYFIIGILVRFAWKKYICIDSISKVSATVHKRDGMGKAELPQIVQNLQFKIRVFALCLLLYNARHPGYIVHRPSHSGSPHSSALCNITSCRPSIQCTVFSTLSEDELMAKSTSYDDCRCGWLKVIFRFDYRRIEQMNVQYLW
jgi:hypothetical protein